MVAAGDIGTAARRRNRDQRSDRANKKAAHRAPLFVNCIYVVSANAGTHAPRLLDLALGPDGFPTTIIGGYGSQSLPSGRQ
jgi:hypothetical protein